MIKDQSGSITEICVLSKKRKDNESSECIHETKSKYMMPKATAFEKLVADDRGSKSVSKHEKKKILGILCFD